jgi:site-specific recombinase XerD
LSLPMIGKLLGHSQPATTARYAHLADDPVSLAATSVADHIGNLMGRNSRP